VITTQKEGELPSILSFHVTPLDEANPHNQRPSIFTAFSTCSQVNALVRMSTGIPTVGTVGRDFPSLYLLPETIVDWIEVPQTFLMLWDLHYTNS